MFIQKRIEDGIALIVSASFASASVADWTTYKGLGIETVQFPCVKVICQDWENLYKEVNAGIGRAHITITTCALKVDTMASDFESKSDLVFNPFFANTINSDLQSKCSNMVIHLVTDEGLEVATMDDGWTATQKLQVVCSRTS